LTELSRSTASSGSRRGAPRCSRGCAPRGPGVGVHYPPNHVQPAFAAWHRPLPRTELAGRQVLSLPFHPALDIKDAGRVAGLLGEALR
jgi:dTDP-4-amino-4,6-dideoxygalactose transaminase